MHSNCGNEGIGRRSLFKFGTVAMVTHGLGGVPLQARAAEGATGTSPASDIDTAMVDSPKALLCGSVSTGL